MTERQQSSVRFDHVGVSVPDFEEAVEWYGIALELTPATPFAIPGSNLRGVMLSHPTGYRIELVHRDDSVPGLRPSSAHDAAGTQGYGHICLSVDDVQTEFDRLVSLGAEPRMQPSPSPRPGATVSFVADPWGNLIEVITSR